MDEFEVIYSKYSPLVFRYLLSLGGDFTSAEEITAETFYRAYINFDKYRGESKIETWLCAIAKNEYFKDCKRKAKQQLRKKQIAHLIKQTLLNTSWIRNRLLQYIKSFTGLLIHIKKSFCFGYWENSVSREYQIFLESPNLGQKSLFSERSLK